MKQHETYKSVLMSEDLGEDHRESIVECAVSIFDDQTEIDVIETETDKLELKVPHRLRPTDKNELCRYIEDLVADRLTPDETIILDKRVSWPNPKYEICIGHE